MQPSLNFSKRHSKMSVFKGTLGCPILVRRRLRCQAGPSILKNLDKSISEAKQRGWITYEELARVLPDDMLGAEDFDRLIAQLGDAGIKVVECAADFEDSTASVQTNSSDNAVAEQARVQVSLTPLEAKALRMRFGIDSDQGSSLDAVADALNLTPARTLEVERDALEKLRAPKPKRIRP